MPTYRFEKVEQYAEKNVKCAGGCGRRLRRQTTLWQTISPFNKNAEGRVKTRTEIRAELRAQADTWRKEPVTCRHCQAGAAQ